MRLGALEAGGTKMVCAIGNANGEIYERISIPTETPEITVPKMIEYFKPKVIRVEAKEREEEDNIIRIEIHNSVPQKKQEDDTIDIEHNEE